MGADDDATLRAICLADFEITLNAGYTKPVAFITTADRDELVEIIKHHYVLYRSKAALDQLLEGLSTFGVADAARKHPQLLEEFFVAEKLSPITAGNFKVTNALDDIINMHCSVPLLLPSQME